MLKSYLKLLNYGRIWSTLDSWDDIVLSDFDRTLELIDRLETDYLRFLCYDLPANFNGIYKTYEYSRLCTILEGEKLISVNSNETFKYNKNQFLLLPPESDVHMKINQRTKAVVYELNTELIRQVSEKICNEYSIEKRILSQKDYYIGRKNKDLIRILNQIMCEFIKDKVDLKFLIDLHAQELVYILMQNKGIYRLLNTESNHPVNRAIRYMKDNCLAPYSIRQLSYDLDMSESYLCRYFKKIIGISPNEYLMKLKMEKAKELLREKSVTETAFDLGYDNISYFIYLFKKEFGITPKQFKMMEIN